MLTIVALGFFSGTAAAAMALSNGAGIFMTLVAYSAAGTLAMLAPIVAQLLLGEANEEEAWDRQKDDGAHIGA